MAITRTLAGLLLEDDFNRSDSDTVGGNWVERSGDWDIVSNRLSITDSTSNRFCENTSASVGKAFGQCVLRSSDIDPTGGRTMLVLRFAWNSGNVHGFMMQADGNSDEWRLSLWNNGVLTTLDTIAHTFNDNTDYPVQLYVADGDQQGWGDGNGVFGASTAHNGANSRSMAVRFGRNAGTPTGMVDDVIWCRDRIITVTGLPTGWKAKVLNNSASVVAEDTESGGLAAIRMDRNGGCTDLIPIGGFPALIVTNSSDVEQFRYDATGVYPGDDYELSLVVVGGTRASTVTLFAPTIIAEPLVVTAAIASTVALYGPTVQRSGYVEAAHIASTAVLYAPLISGPEQPSITPTATGPRSVQAVGSMYIHQLDVPIGGVEWRVATDAGMSTDLVAVEIEYSDPADAPDPLSYGWADLEPSTTYWFDVRYKDQDGIYSSRSAAVSETTDAEVAPNTPTITSASVGTDSVALVSSVLSDPLGRTHVLSRWQVDLASGNYSSPVNENLEDSDGLTSESFVGLPAGTPLKARVKYVVDDGAESAYSASKFFTTLSVPANRPAQPTVTVDQITQTSARFSRGTAYSDPTGSPHRRTRIYVDNWPGGQTFGLAYRVLDVTVLPSQVPYVLSGLTPGGTFYTVVIRDQAEDLDWSDWSPAVEFDTVAPPLGGALLQIQQPRQGEPIRGAAVSVEWTPASESGSTFEIEYSIDQRVTWLPLADGITTSPYLWDVSALVDGVYFFRLRAVEGDEVTGWQERIVYVDNANAEAGEIYLFNYDAEAGTTLGDWDAVWEETGVTWSVGSAGDVRFTGPNISTFESAFTYQPAFEPRQVDVIGEVMIGSTGGSFPWQWFPEQSWAGVGVFSAGPVTGTGPRDGITATIYALPIAAFGDCELRGSGDGFLEIAVYDNGKRIYNVIEPIGRVHVVNQFSGCNKVPRYGVRLRLTTIADLPGSRRRLRIQASVTGRGIDSPTDGWHHQGTVETGLDCGFAAFTARQITTTSNPYRSFSNLTVIPYEYGSCSAPPNFSEPVDIETCPPPFFDLTIFGDDDLTPLWGSVDEYGDIVEASFSTDPNHPRPWLRRWTAGSEHEVDPIAGGSNVGTLLAEVIDKRLEPCDQGTGFLTFYGGDAEGFSAYIGRRAVARERLTDGSIHIVQNGPITEVTLLDTMVTYRFTISSMRERERDVPLFDTQYETSSAFPLGPVYGYGYLGEAYGEDQRYWLPIVGVATGNWQELAPVLPGITLGEIFVDEDSNFPTLATIVSLGVSKAIYDAGGYVGHFFTDFVIRWRYPDEYDEDWRYIREMPAEPGSQAFFLGTEITDRLSNVDVVRMNAFTADGLLPNNGEDIEFQVLANNEPSEEFPFYWEGNMGTLLRLIYDGAFSPESPAILYDEACMAAFEAVAPWARLRKTESEEDLRSWVESNIYQAIGWLPGLTEDGRICPIDANPPDADESLLTLDNAVVIGANWSQDGSRATPIATYRFLREYIDGDSLGGITAIPVDVVRLSARAGALLKSKALLMEPETIRSIGGQLDGEFFPEFYDDAAIGIATERVTALVDQNAFGPQLVQVRARDTVGVRELTVGSWVILESAWIPNLSTLRRGGPQLALIIRRQKDPGLAWDMTMILAGPADPGLDAPETGEPEVGDQNQVCLYVVVPDDYEIEEAENPGGSLPPGGEPPTGASWYLDPGIFANTAALKADTTLFIPGFINEAGGETGSGITINPTPPAGAINSKTVRMTYVRGTNGCTSIELTLFSIRLAPAQEIWHEFRLRWSPDFSTQNDTCPPNDHKLYFGDTVSDESGRWAVYVSQGIQVERPRDPDLGPGFTGAYAANLNTSPVLNASDLWDGNWHLFRFYTKCSTTTTSDDGAMRLYIDGRLMHDEVGFNTCKSAADGNGPERNDGNSFCHNQDDGPPNLIMELDWDYVSMETTDPGW